MVYPYEGTPGKHENIAEALYGLIWNSPRYSVKVEKRRCRTVSSCRATI